MDEDLQHTLGIEHALHRKKILHGIIRLQNDYVEKSQKDAVAAATAALQASQSNMGQTTTMYAGRGDAATAYGGTSNGGQTPGVMSVTQSIFNDGASIASSRAGGLNRMTSGRSVASGAGSPARTMQSVALEQAENAAAARAQAREGSMLKLDELTSWVRHNKGKQLAEALAGLPDVRFDAGLVKTQFVPGFGTEYIDSLNGPAFHINKADDKGNTLLTVAAQNGRMKVAQLLVKKGANPNHQNGQGNTPMHFAMSYKFHDLAAWLVDPEKGGASDEVINAAGLGPYDGLE